MSPAERERQSQALAQAWTIFHVGPDDPLHLRAIWGERARNLTFRPTIYPDPADRRRAFEEAALDLNGRGYNIYTTVNAVQPSFAGDEHNGLAVADQHIVSRRYLLIDIDRAETSDPATDDEIDEIFAVAHEIERQLFYSKGAEPMTVCSGNGAHVYLPLANLPNDDASKLLCQRALRALAAKYDTASVKVDTSVFNASRIVKVPGTIARKGQETEERPYRMAHVVT